MSWSLKNFNELTTDELYEILKLRVDVFVVEQNCPYPEIDNFDQAAKHLFLREDEEIIAYSRLIPSGVKFEEASIGRVITKPGKRRSGLGTELVNKSIESLVASGAEKIVIEAQAHLQSFYGNCGFRTISEEFLLDGIMHVNMLYEHK
ncbi:GNAT family N-acetyltransferase [Bacillaceae bacterium W0354]